MWRLNFCCQFIFKVSIGLALDLPKGSGCSTVRLRGSKNKISILLSNKVRFSTLDNISSYHVRFLVKFHEFSPNFRIETSYFSQMSCRNIGTFPFWKPIGFVRPLNEPGLPSCEWSRGAWELSPSDLASNSQLILKHLNTWKSGRFKYTVKHIEPSKILKHLISWQSRRFKCKLYIYIYWSL